MFIWLCVYKCICKHAHVHMSCILSECVYCMSTCLSVWVHLYKRVCERTLWGEPMLGRMVQESRSLQMNDRSIASDQYCQPNSHASSAGLRHRWEEGARMAACRDMMRPICHWGRTLFKAPHYDQSAEVPEHFPLNHRAICSLSPVSNSVTRNSYPQHPILLAMAPIPRLWPAYVLEGRWAIPDSVQQLLSILCSAVTLEVTPGPWHWNDLSGPNNCGCSGAYLLNLLYTWWTPRPAMGYCSFPPWPPLLKAKVNVAPA